jgi:hypothetical protein
MDGPTMPADPPGVDEDAAHSGLARRLFVVCDSEKPLRHTAAGFVAAGAASGGGVEDEAAPSATEALCRDSSAVPLWLAILLFYLQEKAVAENRWKRRCGVGDFFFREQPGIIIFSRASENS